MISCEFFGGLGNNLFQLATILAIHKKYGYGLQIPSTTNRGNIGIYGQETDLELSSLFENEFTYSNSPLSKKYTHTDLDPAKSDFSYVEVPITDDTCYSGYFQSDKYFLGVDISKELKLKTENINLILNNSSGIFEKKTIALHYRLGGDRVTSHMQHYHKNVSVDFYRKALSLISDYSEETYNILVFSDNMPMCQHLLQNFEYPLLFMQSDNNIVDFTAMSLCDVNIVGNSTFSWWAAYMNQKPSKKIIVTESEWLGPGYSHFNLKDIFPKSWIRL